MIKLNPGSALDHDGAYAIRRAGDTQVVALLGSIGSGKTTLIAGLLQGFLNGNVAGYRFRRSDTLMAFEERCFDSRVASGADVASTGRTSSISGQHYYHLEVQVESGDRTKRLLLLDMSGEFYEAALNTNHDARELHVLSGVDRVVHLLDGGNLALSNRRDKVFATTKKLTRRLYETGVLTHDVPVQMIVSKLDKLAQEPEEVSIRDAVGSVEERFSKERVRGQWTFAGIASSPDVNSPFPLRFGVPELFASWLSDSPPSEVVSPKIRIGADALSSLGVAWAPERYISE